MRWKLDKISASYFDVVMNVAGERRAGRGGG